jgi:hypothetical protein
MNNQNLLSLQEPKGDNQNGTNFSFGRSWGWRSGAMAGDTREKEELIETRDAVIKDRTYAQTRHMVGRKVLHPYKWWFKGKFA